MTTKSNQKGFSAVEGLLILIAVVLIGFVGFYVYNANKKTADTLKNTPASTSSNTNITPKAVESTLKTYHDTVGRFTVQYPDTATIDFPKDYNDAQSTLANITFADRTVLTLTSNLGGRGIAGGCTYDEATGVTTWSDPEISNSRCPYLQITAAKKLSSTAQDRDGKTQNVYVVDNNVVSFDEDGKATTSRASCLTLALTSPVNKKAYGPTFVDPELTTYSVNSSTDRFIHACSAKDANSDADYFTKPSTVEAKKVLDSFKLDS